MNRQTLWFALMLATVVTVAGLNGCDGCSGNPRLHEIMVTVTTAPPVTMAPSAQTMVAATVTNDKSKEGVNWSCTPGNSAATCGSFNPPQTASGANTTYTAPPTAVGAVTLVATSVKDPNAFGTAPTNIATTITVTISTPPPTKMETSAMANIAATVTGDPQNKGVTWSCTPVNSCGSFNTTSPLDATYTAPPSVPAGGTVTITATSVADNNISSLPVTVTILAPNPETFTFYLSGLENFNLGQRAVPNFYALAGAVTIDLTTGLVTAGEQDYNDAIGITSPQPSGDAITGGVLNINSNGQGTLSLVTNNSSVGVNGTETLGVQFVNNKHALIMEFDGGTTSSGTMDFQTLPDSFGGNFAFSFSGVDPNYQAFVVGGVFNIDGTVLSDGVLDFNDDGETGTEDPFSGTVSAPDSFGRGTISPTIGPSTLNYYIVGSEAARLIDVDTTDSAVGSAFGQGSGTFNNASVGASVFGVGSSSYGLVEGGDFSGTLYDAAGQITTSNTSSSPASFAGVGDDNELGATFLDEAISGNYTIGIDGINGYGLLSVGSETLGDVQTLGVYMVDPTLNITDPNNTTTSLGGALLVDLDSILPGSGILVPQTNTATASFNGSYGFGAQDFAADITEDQDQSGWEFDFVGQGSFSPSVTNAPGLISDPFNLFETGNLEISNATFSIAPQADGTFAGRYVSEPLTITPTPKELTAPFALPTVIYQADGGLLLWMSSNFQGNDNDISSSGGTVEQQTLPITTPAIPQPSMKVTTPKN